MLVSVNPAEGKEIFEYWGGRFGVPSGALAELRFLVRGRNMWAVADLNGLDEAFASLKVEAAGVPFLRRQRHMWKPTTAALLFLGDVITKNVVNLTEEQLQPFLRGEMLAEPFVVDGGYVAVRHGEKMLGCALYGKAGLKSQLPRAWVAVLLGGKAEVAEEQ